ncbi:diaminopimelate epimerase [Petroclostridium xylanilyticum]|uniref:diaminopimelate epimerase n=1 Tax=Petroclostridium xylanilyticum TaxID=1792311 RepID=UPI000B98AE95|nr:diaminopimelate epimerase [Petroclostridium xylanilyticum]
MKFTKMQGIGNDYVYVNCFEEKVENPSGVAVKISDRHFGIGSDGLVLIMPSDTEDFKMRMFNSDGSEAEMCGNAIRCVGKYVYDNGLTDKDTISIETLAGTKILKMEIEDGKVKMVRVDMGEPILEPEKIPVIHAKERFVNEEVEVDGEKYKVTCVSMGNPHAIIYMKDIDNLKIEEIGPKFEHHKIFPRRTNTEFVEVIDRQTLKMRVWERGAGETLACGTGACAVLVASVLNGVSERKATVKLKGGDLLIEWSQEDNHVYMTGPAVKVFDGEIEI